MKMNTKELTDQIYDTLLGNVGLSKYHIALDTNKITNQFCDAIAGEIELEISGKLYKIKITQEKYNWFKET